MAYSAKTSDMDGFNLDIIAMGSKRRAVEQSESEYKLTKQNFPPITSRKMNGGMQTDDKIKIAAAKKIDRIYSDPPRRSRPAQNISEHKKARQSSSPHHQDTKTVHQPNKRIQQVENPLYKASEQENNLPRKRKKQVYSAKKSSGSYIITQRDKNRKPIPSGSISAIIILTVVLLYLIVLYIQVYEFSEAISDMKNDLSEKMMTKATWETKIEEKNPSLDQIEKFATEDGMIRKTPDKYISINPGEDVIEKYHTENKEE